MPRLLPTLFILFSVLILCVPGHARAASYKALYGDLAVDIEPTEDGGAVLNLAAGGGRIKAKATSFADNGLVVMGQDQTPLMLVFKAEKYLVLLATHPDLEPYEGVVFAPDVSEEQEGDLWLPPTAVYSGDGAFLAITDQGEGYVNVLLEFQDDMPDMEGQLRNMNTVVIYDGDKIGMAIFYQEDGALVYSVSFGPGKGWSLKLDVDTEASEGVRNELEASKPGGTWANEYGSITAAYEAEGMGSVTIATPKCSFQGLAYFYPDHTATLVNDNGDPQAVLFMEEDFAIIKEVDPNFCSGGQDFYEPFTIPGAPAPEFMEPNGLYANADNDVISIDYVGEGTVEFEMKAGDCEYKGLGGTYISNGTVLYDDNVNTVALVFYYADYAVLVRVGRGVCPDCFTCDNVYYSFRAE